jgi:hypothetical protein
MLSVHFRTEMSCSVAEKSSNALLVLCPATKAPKIWTGLGRRATKGAPSSLQFNFSKLGSKTLQRESLFQNANELLGG